MLDKYSVHEALDRCHLISCLIDDQLLHHPVVASNSKLSELISGAIESLGDAYQLLGEYKINAGQNIDGSL